MATKIYLDFSKVEERSHWNTTHIPEGVYSAKVEGVQRTKAQDGTDMLVYAFTLIDSKYQTRRFPYYCKLQPNQLWKLRDLLVASGLKVPKKAQHVDPEKIVGATVAIEVADDTYQGNLRSTVTGVYPQSILGKEETTEEIPTATPPKFNGDFEGDDEDYEDYDDYDDFDDFDGNIDDDLDSED